MTIGIYIITNTINGKIYIGKSKNIERRFKQHKSYMKNKNLDNKRCNPLLWYSCKKYGIDSFTFEILQSFKIFNDEVLKDAELFWIEFYGCTDRELGYNLRKDSSSNMVVHPETSNKISLNLKNQWKNNLRSNHSLKMKENWKTRDKNKQSELLKKHLTKYSYNVYEGNILLYCLSYSELKEKGLASCLSSFSRKKTDRVNFKNFIIERVTHESKA